MEFTGFVDAMVPIVLEDRRVWILWLEGDRLEDVRRPLRTLDLRLAVMDPDFDPVAAEIPSIVRRAGGGSRGPAADVVWDGRRFEVELPSGVRFPLTLERMSLLGKKSRAEVVPVVDKTGRFRTGLHRTGCRV